MNKSTTGLWVALGLFFLMMLVMGVRLMHIREPWWFLVALAVSTVLLVIVFRFVSRRHK